ncbi:ADP-ribosylglycohydrolase family protein [Chitinophaga agrisoli]|uniref:ADP-ribosylglycohydrolase family protein n=1 Tax=Chitinophaga agrisoli TaxID=2607653 RepID=UPI001661E536|nr:ADP-ribosylglycohydrolase family protein [Chitinophaga agrisoli]
MNAEEKNISIEDRLVACLIGGAIGDAWGSAFENQPKVDNRKTFYWAPPKEPIREWAFTDDTQLTMATCEALLENKMVSPEILARYFVKYYRQRRLSGLGASTLKAIRELEAGVHWSQVGRSGEYAAGNGAAMRIAPFAFQTNLSREDLRQLCRITHRNEEAYVGALAVVLAIRAAIAGTWDGSNNLLEIIIPQLPDTLVRDRFITINERNASIADIATLGTDGYVVNAIPFAIFAASRVKGGEDMYGMFQSVIEAGGDTDTNASIAGQIAGALVGMEGIPVDLIEKMTDLDDFDRLIEIVDRMRNYVS